MLRLLEQVQGFGRAEKGQVVVGQDDVIDARLGRELVLHGLGCLNARDGRTKARAPQVSLQQGSIIQAVLNQEHVESTDRWRRGRRRGGVMVAVRVHRPGRGDASTVFQESQRKLRAVASRATLTHVHRFGGHSLSTSQYMPSLLVASAKSEKLTGLRM